MQNNSYPQNQDEAEKFAAGCIKLLHSPQTRAKNMQDLTDNRIPIAARIATVVSHIMTKMVMEVQTKTNRKPYMQLLVSAIKMLIIDCSRMMLIAGIDVSNSDKQKAAKLVGDMLESGFNQQPQQGQAPMQPGIAQGSQQPIQGQQKPMQQQGLVQGAM